MIDASGAVTFALGLWIGSMIGLVAGMVLTFDRRERDKQKENAWGSPK